MRAKLPAFLFLLLAAGAGSAGAQAVAAAGKVEKVIVYRGQAAVTRQISVEAPAGDVELTVTGLPEQIVPESLFAEAGDGTDVRAVRYRASATGEEPRDAVRELDRQIEEVTERQAANASNQELARRKLATLEKMEVFAATTAAAEIQKGVLNAETLERLVTFGFAQRKSAGDELLSLQKEEKELGKERGLLDRRRAELTRGASRTERTAVVFLEKRGAGPATVRVSYLVNGCGWSPSYNLRATGDLTAVEIESNAIIQQLSGEDWTGVELTLSTASPALSAEGPGLAPFEVALAAAAPKQQAGTGASVADQFRAARSQQQVLLSQNANVFNVQDSIQTAYAANVMANAWQVLELNEAPEVLDKAIAGDPAAVGGPSLTYPIGPPVSLASRSDQQMVRIARFRVPARFYHVATPVLTGYVYREAELDNTSSQDLLGGTISAWLDGRFVGRGEIETVARGQSFVVGFGADPQIRSRREPAGREEKVQGGNKVITARFRLSIENFRETPVRVRVYERVPWSDTQDLLRVTLGTLSDPLSEDATYARIERTKGILRWDLDVPAGSSAEKARVVTYSYTVEHDRNFALTAPAEDSQGRSKAQFEELEKQRQSR